MRFRCKTCGHTPRRIVSVTVKTKGLAVGPTQLASMSRQHKRPCGCDCHSGASS